MYRTRVKYWSQSSLAYWVRGLFDVTVPRSGTAKQWVEWEAEFLQSHPYVYWFTEEFLDTAQDWVMFPIDLVEAISLWVGNVVSGSHQLPSTLSRGEWHPVGDRVLDGIFEMIRDYVECDLAWYWVIRNDIPVKWYDRGLIGNVRQYRNAEYGMAILERDIAEASDGSSVSEIKALYEWWTITHPAMLEEIANRYANLADDVWGDITPAAEEMYAEIRELEAELDRQETEMLQRAIAIRHDMCV